MITIFVFLLAFANAGRLLKENAGGWTGEHALEAEDLDVWTQASRASSNPDLLGLESPVSVRTQVVAGINYVFTFADGSEVTVYSQPWLDNLEVSDVTRPNPVKHQIGGLGGVGPRWTWDENAEKPEGVEDMGGYTASVYTPEQQQRLNVDKLGSPRNTIDMAGVIPQEVPTGNFGGSGGIGPVWTYDDSVEPPAGVKDMGGWTAAVYTEEQMARLGVDEDGTPTNQDHPVFGANGHGLPPVWLPVETDNVKFGENGHGQQHMFGQDGHGLGPASTREEKSMLGQDGHGLGPAYTREEQAKVGEDGHGQQHMLGQDGHGLGPEYTREDKPMLGADGHGLGPAYTQEDSGMLGQDGHGQQHMLGQDGHGQKKMLGEDGHGLGPEYTREDKPILGQDGHGQQKTLGQDGHGQQHMLGQDGHGLGPAYTREDKPMLGADGHGLGPAYTREESGMLGQDGHGQQHMLGQDGHGQQQMLGQNGHGLGPESTWEETNMVGQDGHGQQQMLGQNGHGLGPASTWEEPSMLGQDGHGQQHMLGQDGHGLPPTELRLGSRGEGPAWTYDPNVERPAGTEDMGDYTVSVYTPEQQARMNIDRLGNTRPQKTEDSSDSSSDSSVAFLKVFRVLRAVFGL